MCREKQNRNKRTFLRRKRNKETNNRNKQPNEQHKETIKQTQHNNMSSIATTTVVDEAIIYDDAGLITGFKDDKILVPPTSDDNVEGIAVVDEESFQRAKKAVENKKRPREEEKCPAKEPLPKRPRSTSAEAILPTQSDEVVPDIWGDLVRFQETVVDPVVKALEGLERQNRELDRKLDRKLHRKLTRGNSDPLPSKRPEAKKLPAEITVTIAVKGLTASVNKKAEEEIGNVWASAVLTVHDGKTAINIENIDVYTHDGTFTVELTLPVPALQNPEEVKGDLRSWLETILDNSGSRASFSCSALKDGKFTILR